MKRRRRKIVEKSTPKEEDKEEIIISWKYHLIKSILFLFIFLLLHTLYTNYIFKPIFHKTSQHTLNKEDIIAKLCPKDVENCNYDLNSDEIMHMMNKNN